MSIRVAIDATPLLLPRTGIGNYTYELLQQFGRMSDRVATTALSNRSLPPDALDSRNALALSPYPSRWLWLNFKLPTQIRRSTFDLAHFPNNSAPSVCRVPFVLTIHDASLLRFPQFHPWQRRVSIGMQLRRSAQQAARVITVSNHAKQELITYLKLPAEQIDVVYQSAGEHFRPIVDPAQLQSIRRRYDLPDRFILSVSTNEPRKNLTRLIEAFGAYVHADPALNDVHLVLVGDDGWGDNGIEASVEALGIASRVKLLGYVPEMDLPAIYTLASVFAYPSLHEGFGMPPLEAMACGTPVLTSRQTAMEEVCRNGAHYCDPQSMRDIGVKLRELLSSAELRHRLVERGQNIANLYAWSRTAAQTIDIYEQVIGQQKQAKRCKKL